MNENGPIGKEDEGKCIISHYLEMIHDPNGMQLIGWDT